MKKHWIIKEVEEKGWTKEDLQYMHLGALKSMLEDTFFSDTEKVEEIKELTKAYEEALAIAHDKKYEEILKEC